MRRIPKSAPFISLMVNSAHRPSVACVILSKGLMWRFSEEKKQSRTLDPAPTMSQAVTAHHGTRSQNISSIHFRPSACALLSRERYSLQTRSLSEPLVLGCAKVFTS